MAKSKAEKVVDEVVGQDCGPGWHDVPNGRGWQVRAVRGAIKLRKTPKGGTILEPNEEVGVGET